MRQKEWTISLNRFGGFAPRYYENSYPSYGNKEHAADIKNINLLDPTVLAPGKTPTALTAGTLSTLIKGLSKYAVSSGLGYGVGGAKLYQFSSSAVTNAGIWPHTIDKGTVTGEDGEDVCHYKGALFYFYNHSGSAGDFGRYDLDTTFDDDYGSTIPTGAAALSNAPHQGIVGGDDIMYFTNGIYIGYLDGTTLNTQALDFFTDSVVSSISWNHNRIYAAVNRPNIAGSNFNQSGVYRWNGYSSTWEGDPVEVNGRIGALYTSNGVTFIWYEGFEQGSSRLFFGYVNGGRITVLKTFTGGLPLYYQVAQMGDYLIWVAGQNVYIYGPMSTELSTQMFSIMTAKYATVGGLSAPFGDIMECSNATTNYQLSKGTNYDTTGYYYTKQLDVSGLYSKSEIDELVVQCETLAANARVDLTLRDNAGTALWTDTLSYSGDGAVRRKIFNPRVTTDNFRVEISNANGNATNAVKIRGIYVSGHSIK